MDVNSTPPPRRKRQGKKNTAGHNVSGANSDHDRPQQQDVPSVDGTGSRPGSGTPAKQAYAGPTFHASPAPSSLPMPRFLSRSVPANQNEQPSLQTKLDGDETPDKAAEETPLDFFFKAQKAEQARHQRIESLATPSRQPMQGKEVFMMELDGTDDSDDQTVLVPFKQRMDATRSNTSTPVSQTDLDEDERRLKSEALKRLLTTSANSQELSTGSGSRLSGSPLRPSSAQNSHLPRVAAERPASNDGPARQASDVRSMEDSLRRILKLDPESN